MIRYLLKYSIGHCLRCINTNDVSEHSQSSVSRVDTQNIVCIKFTFDSGQRQTVLVGTKDWCVHQQTKFTQTLSLLQHLDLAFQCHCREHMFELNYLESNASSVAG
jgi:hypothetical protein